MAVRQFRVFPPEVVPFHALMTSPGTEFFRKHFQFREAASPENELTFLGGMLVLSDRSHPIVINYVQINAQRIILEVAGDSGDADLVYIAILAYLTVYDPKEKISKLDPLLFTHETQCVVRLRIEWHELLSDRFWKFLGADAISGIRSGDASSRITAMNLRFTFQYEASDQRLRDYGVIHADKSLIVEPRQNTPLSERLYFTQSPLDSHRHLKLLEELEQSVSGSSRKRLKP
jgi:hypothetical protein